MNVWLRMNLATRLAWAFGLLLLVLIGIAGMAGKQISVIHDALDYYSANTTPSLQAVRSWQEKLAAIRMLQAHRGRPWCGLSDAGSRHYLRLHWRCMAC